MRPRGRVRPRVVTRVVTGLHCIWSGVFDLVVQLQWLVSGATGYVGTGAIGAWLCRASVLGGRHARGRYILGTRCFPPLIHGPSTKTLS